MFFSVLESLQATSGVRSFVLTMNTNDAEDKGFIGGSSFDREFWRSQAVVWHQDSSSEAESYLIYLVKLCLATVQYHSTKPARTTCPTTFLIPHCAILPKLLLLSVLSGPVLSPVTEVVRLHPYLENIVKISKGFISLTENGRSSARGCYTGDEAQC